MADSRRRKSQGATKPAWAFYRRHFKWMSAIAPLGHTFPEFYLPLGLRNKPMQGAVLDLSGASQFTAPTFNALAQRHRQTAKRVAALRLRGLILEGIDLSHFGSLVMLDLGWSQLMPATAQALLDSLPPQAQNKLRVLSLPGCPLAGVTLNKFERLSVLDLSFSYLTALELQALLNTLSPQGQASVSHLRLRDMPLTGLNLSGFTHLFRLELGGGGGLTAREAATLLNRMAPETQAELAELDLSGLPLTQVDLSPWGGLSSLHLNWAEGLDEAGLNRLLHTLSRRAQAEIETLDLCGLPIGSLDLSGFDGLLNVNLRAAQVSHPETVATLLEQFAPSTQSQIQSLDLGHVPVSGVNFSGFSGLRKLNLAKAKGLTPQTLQALLDTLPNKAHLTELDLPDFPHIDRSQFTGLVR